MPASAQLGVLNANLRYMYLYRYIYGGSRVAIIVVLEIVYVVLWGLNTMDDWASSQDPTGKSLPPTGICLSWWLLKYVSMSLCHLFLS